MLLSNSISGNIFGDSKLAKEFEAQSQNYKRLVLSRHEMEKTRLRKKTQDGTDIGIDLASGMRLHHGDVLFIDSIKILVEQLPEKVIRVKAKEAQNSELFVMLGHIIGNRHRPIAYENGSIIFPIYGESELDLFKSLFKDMIEKIELKIEEKVFQPHDAMNVHEHG
jgi:urease accessory protein